MQLIANSGIQIHKFNIEIKSDVKLKVGFWERINSENGRIYLEYAQRLKDEEIWVSKTQLLKEGFYDENGKLDEENININLLDAINEETEIIKVNNLNKPLRKFENIWLPLPYFESNNAGINQFGPINWCRLKLIPLEAHNPKSRNLQYQAILVFDTATAKDFSDKESPQVHGEFGTFTLCSDLDMLLNYCDAKFDCDWVEEYLADIVYGGKENVPEDFPSMEYIAHYIYMVKYLSKLEVFPTVQLYPSQVDKLVDVDLVLDIGNSNTCGVLFEATSGKDTFEFNSVKKLKIQDLSQPELFYDEPFSMRLAFHKSDFGEISGTGDNNKFQWPSFVRVGKEAKRLIYEATNTISTDKELVTNHSSPKRYLWDKERAITQWELITTEEGQSSSAINIEGITQQFSSNGSLMRSEGFGVTSNYSRKSLMTFVLIEILAHAMVQINSPEFRSKHGNSTHARRLRRIVITCPTAMVQEEQVTLRQCAEEASIALSRFFAGTYNDDYDEKEDRNKIEIIPSVKDLRKSLADIDERNDWIYDEATCCQLVFLFAEVSKRYLNKCDRYFDLYGKFRNDLDGYNKKSVTIGSIDIGAGTTDLMISSYKYNDEGTTVLTPIPLYWESFNLAGDSLLKAIVKQVIIEGEVKHEAFIGCTGVIENFAKGKRVPNVQKKLNTFFGTDSANIDFTGRQMRQKFNVQISIPIAEKYLQHTKERKENEVLTFDDLFPIYKPSEDLLDYFESHFGFKFQDINWNLCASRIDNIIETVFEPMIKQISILLHVKSCDFVLLAGRPTSLSKISDLFLKFYPVSPDKIITLNDYRVGRWYPFQDGNGYFTDHKSIVAVGASIALMGGKLNKLNGFSFNMNEVKEKLISTAENIGIYDRNSSNIKKIFLTPYDPTAEIEVASLPMMLGFKRLPATTYPGRLLYLLDFDNEAIVKRLRKKFGDIEDELLYREVENYKIKLKGRMPFKFTLEREYDESREELTIDSIEDRDFDDVPQSNFTMKLKTLDEERGYWLDTGEFVLKIKSK